MEGIENVKEVSLDTAFGKPSDNYIVGTLNGVEVAFLSRHGRGHVVNPSEVNYRANIMGMKMLGVEWIISVTACGSLQEEIVPGHMVIIDQFIDRTVQRPATFFEKGIVGHVPFARPLCDVLRGYLKQACESLDEVTYHWGGIYVNMEGPAFSTEAESNMHRSWGAKVIGMTNMTEARLAREAEISLATISMATDYDCWRQGHESVTVEQVMKTAASNVEKAKRIVAETIQLVSKHSGEKPPAQNALFGGGSIMTAKDKIPQDRLVALAPIIKDCFPENTELEARLTFAIA